MKIARLKEIIREEVKKALKEKNGTEVVDPDTDTKTKPVKPVTEPGTDDGEFDIIKKPSEEPVKAEAKKIAEKIGYRYAQILKNKK